jgi:hypothetical protein
MYAKNPSGILSVQMGSLSPGHREDAGPYLMVSEINVPLLEGGLIYRGLLTSALYGWAMELTASNLSDCPWQ